MALKAHFLCYSVVGSGYLLESDLYRWFQTVIPTKDWPCLAFRPLLFAAFWE